MGIQESENMVRVTLTLPPVDVELLDRLAALEGLNRSAEIRSLLAQLRPTLRATVEAFEAALRQKRNLEEVAAEASVGVVGLEGVLNEAERLQSAYLGMMARLEGAAAVSEARAADDEDPPRSNKGGHTPTTPTSGDDR